MDKIIDKTKLSRPTVSKFFNYQKIRPENAIKIYDEALKLLQKKTNEHQSRIAKAEKLTKNFPH